MVSCGRATDWLCCIEIRKLVIVVFWKPKQNERGRRLNFVKTLHVVQLKYIVSYVLEAVCGVSFTVSGEWGTLFCTIGKTHVPLSLQLKRIWSSSAVISSRPCMCYLSDGTAVFLFTCPRHCYKIQTGVGFVLFMAVVWLIWGLCFTKEKENFIFFFIWQLFIVIIWYFEAFSVNTMSKC